MELNIKFTPPTKASTGAEWIAWYDQIRSLGRKNADSAFSKAWASRGSDKASGDAAFRDYMNENGIQISGGTLADIRDSTSRAMDSFSDILSLGKYATLSILFIVLVFVLVIVYKNFSSPEKTAMLIQSAKG